MKDKRTPSQRMAIYEMQAEICSALASPIRLHILDLIAEGEKTSSQLLEILEIPKANLSQHISVLKDAGILQSRREGTSQYLSLGLPMIKDACAIVREILTVRVTTEEKRNAKLKLELKTAK